MSLRRSAEDSRAEAARLLTAADAYDADAAQIEQHVAAWEIGEPRDVAPLHARIVDAQRINAAVAQRAEKARLGEDLATARAAHEAITARITAREAQKRALIEAAPMPIEGLGFGDDGVTYRGVPFEQASSAEQLRVSVAIAMASNPKLRVLRIKDGSLLDERSLAMLEEMADAADYQVWIERVDTSGVVGVVMEDGAVLADFQAAAVAHAEAEYEPA